MADLDHARTAKARLQDALAGHRGVEGVGLTPDGDGYCLRVNVASPDDGHAIPADVDGVEVRIQVVGTLRAHRPNLPDRPDAAPQRERP